MQHLQSAPSHLVEALTSSLRKVLAEKVDDETEALAEKVDGPKQRQLTMLSLRCHHFASMLDAPSHLLTFSFLTMKLLH